MSVDVVAVGETMALFTPRADGVYVRGHAGGESNLAANLAQIGHRTRWVSRLGGDELGDYIRRDLTKRGVEVVAEADDARVTALMVKEFGPEGTTVRYYRSGSAASALDAPSDDRHVADAVWLHVTGVTPALSASCRRATAGYIERARACGTKVSFDVNHRPLLWTDPEDASETLLDLSRRADIVFVGVDEARRLWDIDDAKRFAEMVQLDADREVVFKRGSEGAELIRRDSSCFEPARAVRSVVDPTGAGDAFAAGYLAATLRQADGAARLRLGHLLGKLTVQVAEDIAPPPSEDAIGRALRGPRGSPGAP